MIVGRATITFDGKGQISSVRADFVDKNFNVIYRDFARTLGNSRSSQFNKLFSEVKKSTFSNYVLVQTRDRQDGLMSLSMTHNHFSLSPDRFFEILHEKEAN